MKNKFTKEDLAIWEKLNQRDKLNDTFVRNEFTKRKLKISDISTISLTFRQHGTVFVSDQSSTESYSPVIAIMKCLIKENILKKY